MKAESKLARLILVSPWFLLIFLVIPLLVILNVTLHIRLPLVGTKPLLLNNMIFTLLIGARFFRYLLRLKRGVRYDAGYRRPKGEQSLALPLEQARGALEKGGFRFAADGSYGEKRDLGYLGTTLCYGGLFLLLVTGTWDNLCQFSGTILDGVGQATKLSSIESYRTLIAGPMAARPSALPRMRVVSQVMPGEKYGKGATEIALLEKDGRSQSALLVPPEPFRYGGYEISMSKFVFEPQVVVKTKEGRPVFTGMVKLNPLWKKTEDGFGFYAPFSAENLEGEVYYQPEKSLLKMVLHQEGKEILNTQMVFQVDREVTQGNYVVTCDRMGQWSEIHVVRRRHTELLWLGAIIAAAGLLMRLGIRPQRVWLAQDGPGCRAAIAGAEARKLLKSEG